VALAQRPVPAQSLILALERSVKSGAKKRLGLRIADIRKRKKRGSINKRCALPDRGIAEKCKIANDNTRFE
jgi:hypothetical protein